MRPIIIIHSINLSETSSNKSSLVFINLPCSTSHSPTDSQGILKFWEFLKAFREFQEYGYSPNNSWNSRNLHKQDSEFLALYFHLWGLDGGASIAAYLCETRTVVIDNGISMNLKITMYNVVFQKVEKNNFFSRRKFQLLL